MLDVVPIVVLLVFGCANPFSSPEKTCDPREVRWEDADGNGVGDVGGAVYVGCYPPDGYVSQPPPGGPSDTGDSGDTDTDGMGDSGDSGTPSDSGDSGTSGDSGSDSGDSGDTDTAGVGDSGDSGDSGTTP